MRDREPNLRSTPRARGAGLPKEHVRASEARGHDSTRTGIRIRDACPRAHRARVQTQSLIVSFLVTESSGALVPRPRVDTPPDGPLGWSSEESPGIVPGHGDARGVVGLARARPQAPRRRQDVGRHSRPPLEAPAVTRPAGALSWGGPFRLAAPWRYGPGPAPSESPAAPGERRRVGEPRRRAVGGR